MKRREWLIYIAAIGVLVALIFFEGTRAHTLEERTPLAPAELYRKLAKSQIKLQIVDARPLDEYEDTRVPGAVPFPGCATRIPAADKHIIASVPTVVVTAQGDAAAFAACRAHFTSARNLAGGMEAWSDAGLPEDSGEYVPPKPGAGGGCL